MTGSIPEGTRRQIFADVVAKQDEGKPVVEARSFVAKQHDVTSDQVKSIEREGIEAGWPPLGE
jgi:hypothetical protein